MAFAATLHRDARSAERHAIQIDGTLRDPDWKPLDVVVRDLSSDGFRASMPAPLDVGAEISIGLHGLACREAVVVWREGAEGGCRFKDRLAEADLALAVVATVSAPAWFPASARSELLDTANDVPVERFPRAVRACILTALLVATWGAIVTARLLLG